MKRLFIYIVFLFLLSAGCNKDHLTEPQQFIKLHLVNDCTYFNLSNCNLFVNGKFIETIFFDTSNRIEKNILFNTGFYQIKIVNDVYTYKSEKLYRSRPDNELFFIISCK